MASRDIPQHRMGPSDQRNGGRCTLMMPQGVQGRTGSKKCNMLPEDPCHRYYPCRSGCGPDVDFASCESRDKHEANVHGSGW